MISYDRRVSKAHSERMHFLMKISLHQQQRVFSQQVGYGARVATLEQLPFVLQNEPVRLRVGGKHRRLAEHVRREDGTEPVDPLVDERFWVFCLVGRDELPCLAYEGQAEVSRREFESPATRVAEKEEDGRGGKERKRE